MDAKTGITFLTHLRMQGVISSEDIEKAVEIASTKSPSRAIKDGQAHAYRQNLGGQVQQITFGKGTRWLAMLRRDSGNEIFAINALKLATDNDVFVGSSFLNMLSQTEVGKVALFALGKHEGQNRLGGERHFDHVLRVALASSFYEISIGASLTEIVEAFQAGILHDTLEDTDATVETLRAWNIGENVIRAVQAVTHEDDDEPDSVYLAQVAAGGKLAILTKRYDRLDNIKSLVNAPADFRATKIAEIQKALNEGLWDFDPEGKVLIIRELAKITQ